MTVLQEQAVRMIHDLSDDNVICLIDFMKRFMVPESSDGKMNPTKTSLEDTDFMQEMEAMRIKAKPYFTIGVDSGRIWEEAVEEKYGCID